MKPAKQQSIDNARLLLRTCELGVLSTHSKACDGYPFGSVSTYMSTHEGDVIFYVSDLAQHTKNFSHNQKMCLTVFPPYGGGLLTANQDTSPSVRPKDFKDPNAGARLSLLGQIQPVQRELEPAISERFFNLYPDSRKYQNAHDFAFYKMRTERVRFIGGFGDIHWINEDDWRMTTPVWSSSEQSMIHHMNSDHVDAMQAICTYFTGVKTSTVRMLAINPDGAFYQCNNDKPVFIAFTRKAIESVDVRKILVEQTTIARTALGIDRAAKHA